MVKVTKEEIEEFKRTLRQKGVLLEFMDLIKQNEMRSWDNLFKKYKLSKEKIYRIDHLTREIVEK